MADTTERPVYEISNTKYEIREQVIGQVQQLAGLMEELVPGGMATLSLKGKEAEKQAEVVYNTFSEKLVTTGNLSRFLAIVLVQVGASIEDKELNKLQSTIEANLTMETGTAIMLDFFQLSGQKKTKKSGSQTS